MSLHRSETARAAGAPGFGEGSATTVLARAGVREGQPFVLDADGTYDPALNRFFRELDSWGVRAANSVAAYARDLTLFCRFLHESRGGKAIWTCEEADLRAYKQLRLHGPAQLRVTVATWRRFIAALDKWVAWSLSEGLIEREPFSYRDKSVWTPIGVRRVRVNAASEPHPGPAPVAFLAYPDYLTWRDVGLGGRGLNGRSDPRWRGRHAARDIAFADLLVSTGMRLSEGASLLVPELPAGSRSEGGTLQGIYLAPAVTKRGRARTVFPPPRVNAALRRYVSIERDALVTATAAAGGYRVGRDTILVRRVGPRSLSLADGSQVSYSGLDPPSRASLLLVGTDGEIAGPLALWLGEDGHPVSPASWQSVFRRANARCARAGQELSLSPHVLRHVFAVHMLGLLLRQSVAALGQNPGDTLSSAQLRRLLVGNPLRRLQLLLGHANEATVYTYLDVLDEAQEIVTAALEAFDGEAVVLASASHGEVEAGSGVQE
ncbi:MAG: tyrosine-type recombinase/integrase [Acidimicrobiales bacterium]